MSDGGGIRGFWKWWQDSRAQVERALGSGEWDELAPQINARVHAIHPDLEWELTRGLHAEHAFCLSAKGDLGLRNVAEHWLREGPARDETWEFHAARQPRWSEGLTLGIGGHDVGLDDLRFVIEVDADRERIHVGVHHPEMEAMSEDLRTTVAFLALDALLGEDGVERWVGAVETVVQPPSTGVPPPALRAAIDELARSATGERFAVLQGADPEGNAVFVSVNLALKRIDHLLADVHAEITIALREPTDAGLTTAAEARDLDRLEDDLLAAVGSHAVYVGRETRRAERVIHLYVDRSSDSQAALDAWRARQKRWAIQVALTPDPSWARTAPLRQT